MKDGGLVLSEGGCFLVDLEEVFSCRCLGCFIVVVILGVELQDLFDVLDHSDGDLTGSGIVQGHAEVLMDLATGNLHLARAIIEESFIGSLEPVGHFGHDVWVAVTDFQVVDMPDDSQLFVLDELVGDAGVIGVDNEID